MKSLLYMAFALSLASTGWANPQVKLVTLSEYRGESPEAKATYVYGYVQGMYDYERFSGSYSKVNRPGNPRGSFV